MSDTPRTKAVTFTDGRASTLEPLGAALIVLIFLPVWVVLFVFVVLLESLFPPKYDHFRKDAGGLK